MLDAVVGTPVRRNGVQFRSHAVGLLIYSTRISLAAQPVTLHVPGETRSQHSIEQYQKV